MLILSSSAKTENLKLLKDMEAMEDDALQIRLNLLIEIVLNICASVVKVNLKGIEEFSHVLSELGIERDNQEPVLQAYKAHYLERIAAINNAYEDEGDEDTQLNPKITKKLPLNLSAADDALTVSNPKLVDVEWKVIYTLNSKNLNKVFQPRFLITLTLLTQQGGSVQQGPDVMIEWSSKRNYLKLKKLEFECD